MQDKIRLLAAIMFTDIVGYTALMQQDETNAKDIRDKHRRVLERSITGHKGQIIQYYGDGTLSIFGSAIEAVESAVEIQRELNKEPKIPLRIGIHIGDIVYEDEGAYGDGVNIASRIQSLSVAGGILLSDKVYDEVKNHEGFLTKSYGTFELKHVQRPIEIYAVTNPGLNFPLDEELRSKTEQSFKSIAVLPFVNMSNDPENEYFSDGMTEEILNTLTRIEGLQVTSRTSAFAFKGKLEDIRSIGAKLNVNTILEGSVRRAGERVRVTAQLINSSDGYHIWSETYDRDLKDIFGVQDEISKEIVNTLKTKLVKKEVSSVLVTKHTENMEAYNYYLKGNFYWNKWSPENVLKAIEFFEKAVSEDPGYALAFSNMAGCYVYLAAIGHIKPKEGYSKAKEYASKAIELNDELGESYLALATNDFFFNWDWDSANKNFRKALSLNPGSVAIIHTYGLYLMVIGRYEQAVQYLEKAVSLDPLSLSINSTLGTTYGLAKKYDKAIKQIEKALEIDPEYRAALQDLGWIYWAMGETDKALEIFHRMNELTGSKYRGITELCFVYGKLGETEKAEEYLELLHEREKMEPDSVLYMDLASAYTGLGDLDKAFYYLNKSYEEKYSAVLFIRMPWWNDIHDDPRYHELVEKIGFKEKILMK